MARAFMWTRVEKADAVHFALSGTITETADFEALFLALGDHNVMSAADIDNINSTGVREWMRFIRKVDENGKRLEFIECANAFVAQLNMIAGFAGKSPIRSVLAPYVCTQCDTVAARCVDMGADVMGQVNAPLACSACGGDMEFDDLAELYFAFASAAHR